MASGVQLEPLYRSLRPLGGDDPETRSHGYFQAASIRPTVALNKACCAYLPTPGAGEHQSQKTKHPVWFKPATSPPSSTLPLRNFDITHIWLVLLLNWSLSILSQGLIGTRGTAKQQLKKWLFRRTPQKEDF
ncbi:MAG: hypothetical protein LQ343_003540 [Gyalolechia ehrenbergii]|nr:MAG: hypothetical protein LQ343_003540 [Gyalolechia ehrenbergii]